MIGFDKRVHVLLPEDFLKQLDEQAAVSLMTRSDFIRQALMDKMARHSLTTRSSHDLPTLDEIDPMEFKL